MNSPSLLVPSSPRGLWIALLGPDGAGKSAVVSQLQQQLEPAFARVSQFHFRPMFGKSASGRTPVTHPHAQRPRSSLISLFKLIYWLLDYWYGYLFVVAPRLRRSELVVFDRYFLDTLVDPRRYRLPIRVLGVADWICGLAPRPDLCILLDAPSHVVLRRKREVSPGETRRQRLAYLTMFESLPRSVIVDAERPIADVAQQITAAVLSRAINLSSHEPDAELIANL